jgi:2-hydroxy-6-oxonona-2,4-dienedioate hydrolase
MRTSGEVHEAKRPERRNERLCRCSLNRCLSLALLVFFVFGLFGASRARADFSTNGEVAGLNAQFVNVNGVRTRYYEAGTGEPLVLVHGGDLSGHSSANIWSKDIPLFAREFHVFAPDALGAGMTDNPADDNDLNIQGQVDHIYDFIRGLKVGAVHLVGESSGGGCVFFLALQHPEVVRDLVIVDSDAAAPKISAAGTETADKCPKGPDSEAPDSKDSEAWKCGLLALSSLPDQAFDDEYFLEGKYMSLLPKSQETVAKLKAGAGGELATEDGFNKWKTEWFARIAKEGVLQMPVLIYWGKNDPLSPPANGQALYDLLAKNNPRVRITILDKAGHFPFREFPEKFVDGVSSFIQQAKSQTDADSPQVSSNPSN